MLMILEINNAFGELIECTVQQRRRLREDRQLPAWSCRSCWVREVDGAPSRRALVQNPHKLGDHYTSVRFARSDAGELVGLPEHCEEVLHPPSGSAILCLAFNPAGTLLATGTSSGKLLLWDFQTRGIVRTWDSRCGVSGIWWRIAPDP